MSLPAAFWPISRSDLFAGIGQQTWDPFPLVEKASLLCLGGSSSCGFVKRPLTLRTNLPAQTLSFTFFFFLSFSKFCFLALGRVGLETNLPFFLLKSPYSLQDQEYLAPLLRHCSF